MVSGVIEEEEEDILVEEKFGFDLRFRMMWGADKRIFLMVF